MKNLIFIFLFLGTTYGYSQELVDKEYYLIDSLDISNYTKKDKSILETGIKEFHKAKSDTAKVNALNGICESMMHEDWTLYQLSLIHISEPTRPY